MTGMQRAFFASLLAVLSLTAFAQEDATVVVPSEKEMTTLSAQDFLAEVRKPLRTDAWGEFTGRVTYKSPKGQQKGDLRVRITFTSKSMHTQIVLNDKNVYAMEQVHKEGEAVKTSIEMPETEERPGLFEFGVDPEDLTFSFIYWDFIEELPRESSRLRECRVMRLKDPTGKGTVNVFFSAKHGFPMEASWFREGETKAWRKLEFKGAKRFENGLWFVKEMRLEGDDWKTQVKFDHVALNPVSE